ncbi:MAG: type II toxin-antitoxin system RelE/ParE family toxin [Dehalococcoidia bacterium]
MRVEFDDEDLERLYRDREFRLSALGPELVKAFRKRVGYLEAALDKADIAAMRSNNLEKLQARGDDHSVRINKQYRLIIRFAADSGGPKVIVVGIEDYH